MDFSSILPLRCANQAVAESCRSEGSFACKNCKLVAYCGIACQRLHWPIHKVECRSPLNKSNWTPEWDRANRSPIWASGDASKNLHNPFGSSKYLWGNVPAIDILRVHENEGQGYNKDIKLLFAASGDLRNLIKTIRSLPDSFSRQMDVTVNDWEFDVVARNAVILLLVLASLNDKTSSQPSSDSAVEALIHIWYSAFIPKSLATSLESEIGKLLGDSRTHTTEAVHEGMVRKTWTFSRSKILSITLPPDKWPLVAEYLKTPAGLTQQSAKKIREAVMLSPERADYRDGWYYKDASPSMRLAKRKFRRDGLLLPFSHPRTDFDIPNPTMFQTGDCWPFDDKSDPMAGWCIRDVYEIPWKPSCDMYGKLFVYLREEFQAFLQRLSSLNLRLELFNVDATTLPQLLVPQSYDRVEVSNISDAGYLGTRRVLSLFAPLLQATADNPDATIITCYLNAVMEMANMTGMADTMPDMDFLVQYLPGSLDIVKVLRQGADFYKVWDSRTLALDAENYFQMYMKLQEFESAASRAGLMMKERNTIVEPWPLRLKLKPHEVGSQEEFDLLLSSCSSGIEHYTEWRRLR
ncbi:hypothetical protein J3E71DRAFT_187021 [Bipolaris maydis]|nr:hypothetical protein J3E71DRAFT_187021 [Bipolaris maydis]